TCGGRDLIAALTPAERAALIGTAPFAQGNFWTATRGATHLTIVGTYHLNDPRFAPILARLTPILAKASLLMVEAGPVEEEHLKSDMATHPERLINTNGPTLPEALSAREWQTLSIAMKARGIPPFMAAKFQPWYVSVLLDIPSCNLAANTKGRLGLDGQLIAQAQAHAIPITALEPYDTVFRMFATMSEARQLDMLRLSLVGNTPNAMADMTTTTANAYFAGEHRLLWEFGKAEALKTPGADPAKTRANFDLIEAALLTDRNRAWLPRMIAATTGKTAVIAFGAAHLGGPNGVLNLLQQAGFTLTPLTP
ncbi:MAG: TraB/GumN family protein, partial [Paracoccaceae bacterium]|nr:TraB/GumN family protein [Paracoccaceae bacterium]